MLLCQSESYFTPNHAILLFEDLLLLRGAKQISESFEDLVDGSHILVAVEVSFSDEELFD